MLFCIDKIRDGIFNAVRSLLYFRNTVMITEQLEKNPFFLQLQNIMNR